MKQDLLELEKKAGYQFHDRCLLERAMTHKSYINEAHMEKYESNERLEFLGDAVLELVTSEYLFQDEAKFPEGELTRRRWHSAQDSWILEGISAWEKGRRPPAGETGILLHQTLWRR